MKKTCVRCGKECSKILSHLRNKTICEVKYLDISRDKMMENYDEYYNQFIKQKNNDIFQCEHCDKQYSAKNSYYRHKRSKHKNDDNIPSISINGNNNNNTNNNTNTYIDNSINNNINISINGFGDEKLLSKEIIAKILKEPMNRIIPEYVKQTYIETPENRCIYIPNVRDKFAKVLINGIWEFKLTTPIVDTIINKSSKYIMGNMGDCNRKLIEVNGVKVEDPIRKKRCDFRNYLHDINEDPTKRKIVKNDVVSEIMNGRDKVLETKNNSQHQSTEPVNPDDPDNIIVI